MAQKRQKLIQASKRLEEREEKVALEALREELASLAKELMEGTIWGTGEYGKTLHRIKLPIKDRPVDFPRFSNGPLGLYYREWNVNYDGSLDFNWTNAIKPGNYPLTPADELIVGLKAKKILQKAIEGKWLVKDVAPGYYKDGSPSGHWVLVPKETETSESE